LGHSARPTPGSLFNLENQVRSSTAPCERRAIGLLRDWQTYWRRRKKRADGIACCHDTAIPEKRCRVLEDARRERRRDAKRRALAPLTSLANRGGGKRTSCLAVSTR